MCDVTTCVPFRLKSENRYCSELSKKQIEIVNDEDNWNVILTKELIYTPNYLDII